MSKVTSNDSAKGKSSETFFKVLHFIGRYRFLLILSIVLAAISVILQLYVPILFGNAIDQIVAEHQVNFEMMWYYLSHIQTILNLVDIIGKSGDQCICSESVELCERQMLYVIVNGLS